MKPFFCYYGGKWRSAPHYPAPQFGTIIEPFAGAAGYATRYADRRVILVESDPMIAALWRYLICVPPQEIVRLPMLAHDQTVDDLGDVCAEAKALIGFWLNKGVSHPRTRPSAWMRSGIRPGSFWGEEIRSRIASQVEQIRHWRIVEASYADIPQPAREATWFVDPPYQQQGRYYTHGSDRVDFAHLGAWCRAQRGQVIVCEQEGATWLPFETLGSFKANESRNGKKRTAEVVWTNSVALEGLRP